MNDLKEIAAIIKELADHGIHPGDHGKAVEVAVQIQRNRMLKRALVLGDSDSYPGALEKIAMEIESNGKFLRRIDSSVDDIERKLNSIDDSVSNLRD